MAKTYRLREDAAEALKSRRIKMILETREDFRESELLGALIWKYLGQITTKDVQKYREEVLGKD